MRVTERIFLERASNGEARIQLLRAMTLVDAVGAELALPADRSDPLDASAVAYLPEIGDVGANGDDDACAFVACDAAGSVSHLEGPFVVEERLVGGTQA
jgi:hypothetical protein